VLPAIAKIFGNLQRKVSGHYGSGLALDVSDQDRPPCP
jgi:hypothetical protein